MTEERFIGVWRLVSFELRSSDGATSLPYGDHPHGYIFYTPEGYMSCVFMRAGRPDFASSDALGGSTEEKAQAMESFFSYCGSYEIQGSDVVHHIEASWFPNWSGGDLRRFYQFDGRRLILTGSTPQVFQGQERTAIIVWVRVS